MDDFQKKIVFFISNPDATSLTGPRRMSKDDFMTDLVHVLKQVHPGINICDISDGSAFEIKEGMNAILSIDPPSMKISEMMAAIISDRVLFFYFQELCHQVPVCVKGLHGTEYCLSFKEGNADYW
jgi:hypothetical protein